MKKLYKDPTVEIVELDYDADVIRTSITDIDDDNNDTIVDDPWGDDED